MGRHIDSAAQAAAEAIDAAEAALQAGDGGGALLVLQDVERLPASYARRLYVRAALAASRWDRVVDLMHPLICGHQITPKISLNTRVQ